MNEIERIGDQLKRAFEGEAWHGPSVMQLVEGLTAEQAAAHPVPAAHSIWELVLHIAAWEAVVARRLDGDSTAVSDEEDWPPLSDRSEAAWSAAVERLRSGHHALRDRLKDLPEHRLKDWTASGTSIYGLLHGVIQHDLYHAGQIAILKKALAG